MTGTNGLTNSMHSTGHLTASMLVNNYNSLRFVHELGNFVWLNVLRDIRDPSCSDACIWVEEQITGVLDFRKIFHSVCQADGVSDDLRFANPE